MAKQPKKPIITSDPKDPRIKAYGDSLAAYKSTDYFRKNRISNTDIKKANDPSLLYETKTYKEYLNKKLKPTEVIAYKNQKEFPLYKKPTTPVVYKKPEPKVVKPVSKPEVKSTPVRKDLNQAKTKVRLTPKGIVSAKSVDSLKKIGYGKVIGNAITRAGQTPQYGSSSSDVIKKLLNKNK